MGVTNHFLSGMILQVGMFLVVNYLITVVQPAHTNPNDLHVYKIQRVKLEGLSPSKKRSVGLEVFVFVCVGRV